jgi:hypothetical protein
MNDTKTHMWKFTICSLSPAFLQLILKFTSGILYAHPFNYIVSSLKLPHHVIWLYQAVVVAGEEVTLVISKGGPLCISCGFKLVGYDDDDAVFT